jgi:hypothetical protein
MKCWKELQTIHSFACIPISVCQMGVLGYYFSSSYFRRKRRWSGDSNRMVVCALRRRTQLVV